MLYYALHVIYLPLYFADIKTILLRHDHTLIQELKQH